MSAAGRLASGIACALAAPRLFAGIQSVTAPGGPQARSIYSLFNTYLWVTLVIYLIVIAWLVVAIIRSRRRAEPVTDPVSERPAVVIVSIAAALTIVTLIILLVASISTGHTIGTFGRNKPGQMEIDVTGHQWWWEVSYPDPEPDKSFRTANELHIPVGTPVLLRVATRDVIHSFWIPNLQGKIDLIPGRVNKQWIEADKPGVYRGQCAEFCGLQHAHMAIVVVAEDPKKFDAWKARQQSPARDPVTPAQARGREVFLSLPCANCHAITGVEAYGSIGPDLTHVGSRPTLGAGMLINNAGNMAGWIVNAPAIKPGTAMPPNQLSASELQALLAYLESLE